MALALAVLIAVTAFYMINLTAWDGPGKLAAGTLDFPLHLLVVTAIAALLSLIAWGRKARMASRLFAVTVIATAIMALIPSAAMWQMAQRNGVTPSVREYLNSALKPNYGHAQQQRSVTYGIAPDGATLMLDVWLPQKAPDAGTLRPAMVFVHGGGWTHGNRSSLPMWDRWLNERGYAVFDVEYRMPPPERWLDEVGDVKSALGWVAANAAQYQIDTTRISVMGASAGANLAMLAAYSAGDSTLPPSCSVPVVAVHSVVNFYGPADMALLYRISGTPRNVQGDMITYIGGSPGQYPDRYIALSPLKYVGVNAPPTITFLGTSDRLIPAEQARILDGAMKEASATHEMWLLPAQDHAFDVNWGGFGTQFARAKLDAFLQRNR